MTDWNRDLYRVQVANVLNGRTRDTVLNGTLEHACIVTEEAFKSATNHVRILTEKLDCACYGASGVTHAALSFLADPSARLDILVENGPAVLENNTFLDAIRRTGGERVSVRAVPPETVHTYGFNFLTVDNRAYRFEDDRAHPIAVVGNDPNSAQHLAELFDNLFERSDKVAH